MKWETVTTALTNYTGVMSTVIDTIAENAYLAVFLAVPVFAVACRGVKKLLRVAR
jgi:hypothetical protein